MADHDPSAIVGEHLSLILRWWVVIVAVVSLGYAGVRKGIVAPRTELEKLKSEVGDLRDDMTEHGARIEDLSHKLDKVHDLILRLHTTKEEA